MPMKAKIRIATTTITTIQMRSMAGQCRANGFAAAFLARMRGYDL